jgi:hypothetical protein
MVGPTRPVPDRASGKQVTQAEADYDRKAAAEALDFSRPLDVHRWSDYPEANDVVSRAASILFEDKATSIQRKHLKVILLDLYVAWLEHPDLKVALPMSSKSYKAKGNRYNALGISSLAIEIVDRLADVGLIQIKRGFFDRATGRGKNTRIWASAELLSLFKQCKLEGYQVYQHPDEEVIILRDEKSRDIPYDDTPEIIERRELLKRYNELLSRSFIDIRRLDDPWIEMKDGSKLLISTHRQRVKRVFNRGDFGKGGRFFGPWWQGCPKSWRKEIFINDSPTVEEDYASLHIALLYSRKGINYHEAFEGDAYAVDVPPFLTTPEETRSYAKLLLLIAINAKTPQKAYAAFRQNRGEHDDKLGQTLKDAQLSILLDRLKAKHPHIAEDLGSDAGIDLMNEDAGLTEHVIRHFTDKDVAVLTVHDSYLVPYAYAQELGEVLRAAYGKATGLVTTKTARTGVALGDEESWVKERLPEEAVTRSSGYKKRLIDWMVKENDRRNVTGTDDGSEDEE